MTLIYLNGKYLAPDDAFVSAFDAGLQHGVGVFETMLGVGPAEAGGAPRVHRPVEHLERLAESVTSLGLAEAFDAAPVGELLLETLRRSGLCENPGSRARIRLTVTGGDLNMLDRSGTNAQRPTLMIVVQPSPTPPEEMFQRGVTVTVADLKLNPLDPFQSHKTLNYWPRLHALNQASAKGAAEALLFQVSNHLAGGCVSSVFLVKDAELFAPIARGEEPQGGLPSPVLPGITRMACIQNAEAAGVKVHKRMLTIDDLLAADEVMLTSSTIGVLPVVRVEGHQVGDAKPGPMTRTLREAWLGELG